ncbi:MAG TPA: OsmC family protein [Bryobacteraceae bacterium]|nr:OsmC family protein [Bryobacteraceae bacterium]
MQVLVRHLGNVKFEASTRGHSLLCDQPVENGGSDGGMTPPEVLLAALGTCAGHYAVQYLKSRSLAMEGLEVRVSAEKTLRPARLSSFRIDVTAPGLPPEHEAGLKRAVGACLIHNTLLQAPAIETVLHTEALSPA